jgi:excisionase family DNA binding protein
MSRTLSLDQAAEILKTTTETVSDAIHRRGLPAARIGRAYVLVEDDVVEWLRNQYGNWEHADRRAAIAKEARLDDAERAARKADLKANAKRYRAESIKRKKEVRAGLSRFHASKRRASKLQRTPRWANIAAILAIYREAHRLTRETGIVHHVDHEIPLQGELVSGLHVENNLQILTGSENVRKHNRFEVE